MASLTVRMPALSATMESAELLTWLVAVGDEVRSGQPLAEVSTDKVDMELESPYDGVVAEFLVEAGTEVALGEPVATLSGDEEELLGDLDLEGSEGDVTGAPEAEDSRPADAPAAARSDEAETPETDASRVDGAPRERRGLLLAPPPVRKRAKELGIDLHMVEATGSRGHVTHADLDRHQQREGGAAPDSRSQPESESREPTSSADSMPRREQREQPERGGRRAAIRRATARSTTRSAAIPQFTLYRRIDVGAAAQRRNGRSWTTEIARALAAALWRHPACNAVWDEEAQQPRHLDTVRIGVAVDAADGLVVVGVDDPDGTDPAEADGRIKQAISRAREGKLQPQDLAGISSTISNLGGLGVDRFDALLLPPQATILSVGRMVDTPIVVDGRVRVRPMIEVGLTVDHRVADGADGARMLSTFADRLEL